MPGIKPIPSSEVEKGQETQKPFHERLEVIFRQIEEYEKDVVQQGDKTNVYILISRIFEHSVEDGLKIAARLRLMPSEYRGNVLNAPFAIKHPKIYSRLSEYIERNKTRNFRNEFDNVKLVNESILFDIESLADGRARKDLFTGHQSVWYSEQAKELIAEIDALYTELLKNREVPTKNLGGPEKITADEFAEDHLEHIELVMNGAYYAAPVKKVLFDILSAQNRENSDENFFNTDLITEEEIKFYCDAYKIDFNAIRPKLKGAKYYLTQAAKAENIEAEQKLLKKLKADLNGTGQEVKLDADKDKYVIEDIEKKEERLNEFIEHGYRENSFGYKELSRVWQGFPLGHAHEIVISDGKVYYIAPTGSVLNENHELVYDGSKGPAQHVYNLDGELYFDIKLQHNNVLMDQRLKPLLVTFAPIKEVAVVGGRLLATEFGGEDDHVIHAADSHGRSYLGIYKGVDFPFEHEGKCLFVGKTDQGSEITDLDGKVVYKTDKQISSPVSYAGSIYFIVDQGIGTEFGHFKAYSAEIKPPLIVVGDGLYFTLKRGIDSYIQRYPRIDVSAQYDEIKSLCNDNGKLAFMGLKDGKWHKVVIDVTGEAAEPESEREIDWVSDKRLTLLNAVHHPTKESIQNYHSLNQGNLEGEDELKKKKRGLLGKSVKVAQMFTKAIQEIPEAFINTMAAKMDKAPGVMADRLLSRMFPQTWADEHEVVRSLGKNPFSFGSEQSDVRDALRPHGSTGLEGGGLENMLDPRVVLESREPLDKLVVTGIYGACDPNNGQWTKIHFPVTPAIAEPVAEITLTVPNTKGMKSCILPSPMDTRIIPERVKAIRKGKEESIEASVDAVGQASIENIQKSADKIVYSIQVGAYEPLTEVSDKQYSRYKEMFERTHGQDLEVKLPGLPDEIEAELASPRFKDLAPKDKLIAIEKLVRSLGFYDFDNQTTKESKRSRPVADKMALMCLRVDDLLAQSPEMAQNLRGKEFAGVCADFALITCAALRKAGFLAGVMEGFKPSGKRIRMKDSHAVAFAVWPNETGGNRLVEVDGTPGGADPRLADITQPTLEQKEATAKVQTREVVQKAEKDLQKILDVIESKDVEAIRQLENGSLERSLNALLRYKVKRHHVAKIEELLNVFWYGGLSRKMEKNEPADMLEIRKTIEEYLTSAKVAGQESKEKIEADGTRLFNTISEFVQRFMKSQKTKDPKQALELMDRVLDMARPSLEKTEEQAMAAVITYLKAKKVG